jgi:hypothetical protein
MTPAEAREISGGGIPPLQGGRAIVTPSGAYAVYVLVNGW